MNCYESINLWLKQYTPIGPWLYFNTTPVDLGATSMSPVPGTRTAKKFINGSKLLEITFAINMIKSYDTGTSPINMDAFNEVVNFTDWIELQNENKNFPTFEANQTVQKISVLNNVPSLLVDTASQLAKYTFQARITYLDESEVIFR